MCTRGGEKIDKRAWLPSTAAHLLVVGVLTLKVIFTLHVLTRIDAQILEPLDHASWRGLAGRSYPTVDLQFRIVNLVCVIIAMLCQPDRHQEEVESMLGRQLSRAQQRLRNSGVVAFESVPAETVTRVHVIEEEDKLLDVLRRTL